MLEERTHTSNMSLLLAIAAKASHANLNEV